jgi:hypothetical protein
MALPRPVIGDRDPGRWVRQAVAGGLTKARELQLWRCSKGIKLLDSLTNLAGVYRD